MKKEEKPVITREETYGNDVEETSRHPAFAMVGISRVNGYKKLFGSEVKTGGYIEFRVKKAKETWHLHEKRYFSDHKELLTFSMSYAQFAEVITNLNCGEGIPCTLDYIGGQAVPDIAEDNINTVDQYKLDISEYSNKINKSIDELQKQINELKISNKQKDELSANIRKAKMELNSNLPFVISQCEEAVEHITAKSKIEVEAFAQNRIHELGMQALGMKGESLQIKNGE